jgi:hypothetical protein
MVVDGPFQHARRVDGISAEPSPEIVDDPGQDPLPLRFGFGYGAEEIKLRWAVPLDQGGDPDPEKSHADPPLPS